MAKQKQGEKVTETNIIKEVSEKIENVNENIINEIKDDDAEVNGKENLINDDILTIKEKIDSLKDSFSDAMQNVKEDTDISEIEKTIENALTEGEKIKEELTKTIRNSNFTNFWNGMNYDF